MRLVRQGSWRSGVFGVVAGSWRPVVVSWSVVPVIGHSQLVWGSWEQSVDVRAPEAGSDQSG